MKYPTYFDPKRSLNLFGLIEHFKFLKDLYIKKRLPKVLMLSGNKGSGKSTLVNHLLYFIFDQENYNEKMNEFRLNSSFYNLFLNNIHNNIIYLSGSNFRNIKIEDIRNLKSIIYKTTISNKPRFIILDDVELFNINSLNALLKIIEEPTKNNFFILINNKSKPLIETIKSRCIDVKIILNEKQRINIINLLTKKYKIDFTIHPESSQLSPGNFVKFNYIFNENKIFIEENYIKNLGNLLNSYKKSKEVIFIDMIFFLTDKYINSLKIEKSFTNNKIIEYKKYIFENINKFFIYNLNQNTLLNTINNKIEDE